MRQQLVVQMDVVGKAVHEHDRHPGAGNHLDIQPVLCAPDGQALHGRFHRRSPQFLATWFSPDWVTSLGDGRRS
jgi:hypothetical protein